MHKAEGNHIAAHTAHDDAVAYVENVAAQDNEVAGESCYQALGGDRQPGRDERRGGAQARGVAEPDGDDPDYQHDSEDEADHLPRPEPCPAVAFAEGQPRNQTQRIPQANQNDDESRGEQQLFAVLRADADQFHSEDIQIGGKQLDGHPLFDCQRWS